MIGHAFTYSLPLDLTWVGFNNIEGGDAPTHAKGKNRNKDDFDIPMDQYYKTDESLVLKFGPIDRYCIGFSLYYQGHVRKNHEKGANIGGYSMIVT